MVTVNHATIFRFVLFIFLFSVYLTLVAKVHSFLHCGTFLSRRTADPFCNSHNKSSAAQFYEAYCELSSEPQRVPGPLIRMEKWFTFFSIIIIIIVQIKPVGTNRKGPDEKDSEKRRSKSRRGNEREWRSPMAGSGGVSGYERHRVRSHQEAEGGLWRNDSLQREMNAVVRLEKELCCSQTCWSSWKALGSN